MKSPVKSNKKVRVATGLAILVVLAVILRLTVFQGTFYYAGTLEATRVDVPARVNSTIRKIQAQEGETVKEGEVLLELSCEDYRLAQKLAQQNFDRAERLYRQGAQAKEPYDLAKNKKEETDLKVSWCQVESPLSGTVLSKYYEVGEMVAPGTRLFTLANLQEPYAYFYVPQTMLARLKLDMEIHAILPEIDEREFTGKIVHIGSEAEFTPKNVQTREERTRLVFPVKVEFSNTDGILKPGMTLEARFPES